MSNYVQEIEQVASEFEGGQNQNQNQNQDQNTNSTTQQDNNAPQQQQSTGAHQNQSSGGGNTSMEDGFINDAVDEVASKEGIPAGMDGTLNQMVDQEVNKFL